LHVKVIKVGASFRDSCQELGQSEEDFNTTIAAQKDSKMFSKFLMLVRLYIFIYFFISCHFLALILKLWNVSPISSFNWSVHCEGEHGQDTPDPAALSLLAHLKQDVPEKVEDEDRPNVRRKFEEWW
jgi:hypothetical protein